MTYVEYVEVNAWQMNDYCLRYNNMVRPWQYINRCIYSDL